MDRMPTTNLQSEQRRMTLKDAMKKYALPVLTSLGFIAAGVRDAQANDPSSIEPGRDIHGIEANLQSGAPTSESPTRGGNENSVGLEAEVAIMNTEQFKQYVTDILVLMTPEEQNQFSEFVQNETLRYDALQVGHILPNSGTTEQMWEIIRNPDGAVLVASFTTVTSDKVSIIKSSGIYEVPVGSALFAYTVNGNEGDVATLIPFAGEKIGSYPVNPTEDSASPAAEAVFVTYVVGEDGKPIITTTLGYDDVGLIQQYPGSILVSAVDAARVAKVPAYQFPEGLTTGLVEEAREPRDPSLQTVSSVEQQQPESAAENALSAIEVIGNEILIPRQALTMEQLSQLVATLPENDSQVQGTRQGMKSFHSSNFLIYRVSDVAAQNPDGSPNDGDKRTRVDFAVNVKVNGQTETRYFSYDFHVSTVIDSASRDEATYKVNPDEIEVRWPVGTRMVLNIGVATGGKIYESDLDIACKGLALNDADCGIFKDVMMKSSQEPKKFPNLIAEKASTDPMRPTDFTYQISIGNLSK